MASLRSSVKGLSLGLVVLHHVEEEVRGLFRNEGSVRSFSDLYVVRTVELAT